MMQEVKETKSDFIKGKSLRLNLFADMKLLLPEHIDLSLWNVKVRTLGELKNFGDEAIYT
nr:MAG TPA: hypothetical protein [Caudoviricetes sp.]